MSVSSINRRRLMQMLAVSIVGPAVLNKNAFATNIIEVVPADQPKPVFIPPGGGKKSKIGDGDIVFKLNKDQTSGLLGSTESVLLPGVMGAPPHSHKSFDEVCRVLEGTVTIMVGDEIFEVKAGGWHLRPRGIVHSFWNSGKVPAKFIELYIPGGHEVYMSELADLFINNARPKPGDLDELAAKYDIAFDWAKLKPIMNKYKVHL